MNHQSTSSKVIHFTLWVAQVALATVLAWAAVMKLSQTIETLAAMWPWTAQVPLAMVKFTGVVDLLGAMGLVLPALLRVKPTLTPVAAVAIIVLMISASIFHLVRGEASSIGVNIVFASMAAFVAWGRLTKARILAR